jgi:hypothetical protein
MKSMMLLILTGKFNFSEMLKTFVLSNGSDEVAKVIADNIDWRQLSRSQISKRLRAFKFNFRIIEKVFQRANLSAKEMVDIIKKSTDSIHSACAAIDTKKLSYEQMLDLLEFNIAKQEKSECWWLCENIITTGLLSADQMLAMMRMVWIDGYESILEKAACFAIESGKLNKEQVFAVFKLTNCNYETATAMMQSNLLSFEDIMQILRREDFNDNYNCLKLAAINELDLTAKQIIEIVKESGDGELKNQAIECGGDKLSFKQKLEIVKMIGRDEDGYEYSASRIISSCKLTPSQMLHLLEMTNNDEHIAKAIEKELGGK